MNIHRRAERAVIPQRFLLEQRQESQTTALDRGAIPQPPAGLGPLGRLCEARVLVRLTGGESAPPKLSIYDWSRRVWDSMRGDLIGETLSLWRAGIDASHVGPDGLTRIRLDARQLSEGTEVDAKVDFGLVPPDPLAAELAGAPSGST